MPHRVLRELSLLRHRGTGARAGHGEEEEMVRKRRHVGGRVVVRNGVGGRERVRKGQGRRVTGKKKTKEEGGR